MDNIIKTCNPTIRFSKFSLRKKKIYEEFGGFLSILVWKEIFSMGE